MTENLIHYDSIIFSFCKVILQVDWSELPSLTSLRAFAALAEQKSFTRAATALNVTHAAVSQQVKVLEERLGVSLVTRAGRGIALTSEGASLARDLDSGFAAIHRGVEALAGAGALRPVQISMSPAFATEWLMPRISEFQAQHPEITLLLNPTGEVVELKPGGFDMAIRYRSSDRLEEDVTSVLISDMVVIGTPALIGTRRRQDPAMLVDLPWLQELGTNEVAEWMARRGVTLDRPLIINHMPGNLIMEAVRRGDGITYTARAFFQEEIRSGEVVILHSEAAFGHYFIATCPGVLRPSVRIFIDWLKGKAERVTAASDVKS
jgi:LysR family glycine cleavage system transcriptional activator